MASSLPLSSSLVEKVIDSAWRRRLFVVIVEQLAFTLAIVFAGAILMLLLGTQVLDWYWLLVLAAVGLIVGAVRIRRGLFERYRIAQLLDERLELSDSLSTAWFLRTGDAIPDGPAARYQLEYAEEIAARVQPVVAFPVGGRQAWALTAVMAVVICSLFTLRYFVNSSLSLRPALVSLHMGDMVEPSEKTKAPEKKLVAQTRAIETREVTAGTRQDSPSNPNGQQQQSTLTDPRSDQSANTPASSQSPRSQSGQQNGSQSQGNTPGSDKSESQSGNQKGNEESQASAREGAQQQKGGKESQTASGQQQPSPGLLDKMKDALSGMMAKMNQNSASQDSKQDARNSAASQKGRSDSSSGKNQKAQSQSNQNSESSQNAQASAQASATEKAQAAAGSSSDETAQEKGSDPQSGAGRQDGEKGIRDAEQLKAMGKLAEIIGKRSASVTGEMRLEKPSGRQELQTQYSDKVSSHADLGGEINRDQVPLEYQQYVREYMNQVHKQANAQ